MHTTNTPGPGAGALAGYPHSQGLWAKLQFSGTTSWYFDQKVDKNINNWHKYQRLIKISNLTEISKVDKNVKFDKNINLTKMSILTIISKLTKMSKFTKMPKFIKRPTFKYLPPPPPPPNCWIWYLRSAGPKRKSKKTKVRRPCLWVSVQRINSSRCQKSCVWQRIHRCHSGLRW